MKNSPPMCKMRKGKNIMSTSEIQKQRNKARYDLLKRLNRCVICGNQDAYTMTGKSCCSECLDKRRQYSKQYNANNSEKCKTLRNNLVKRRKESGLCAHCGRQIPAHRLGKATCQICADKAHKKYLQNSKNYK